MIVIKDTVQLLYFKDNTALVMGKLGHLPNVTVVCNVKAGKRASSMIHKATYFQITLSLLVKYFLRIYVPTKLNFISV